MRIYREYIEKYIFHAKYNFGKEKNVIGFNPDFQYIP